MKDLSYPFSSSAIIARASALSVALLTLGSGQLLAQLPSVNKAPWHAFFAGQYASKDVFGVSTDGSLYYNHNADIGVVSTGHFHRIFPSVEETLPSGRVFRNMILTETLKSSDQPTDKPGTITYTAQVKSGATIEVTVEFTRRDISIGGRITDPGPSKNPLKFILLTQAPPYYLLYQEAKRLAEGTPEEKAKLTKTIQHQKQLAAKEFLVLKRLDGNNLKQPLLEEVDLSSDSFNGEGFDSIEVDLEWLKGRKIDITATEGSLMKLSASKPQPLFKHRFNIIWSENPETKSPGKGRMVFTTR